MAFNKSQKQGIIWVSAFVLGAVTLVKWEDIGIGWTIGVWAGFIAVSAIWGKAGNKR